MQPLWHTCDNFYPSRAADPENRSPRLIPLTRGKFAVVDAEDYEELSKYTWAAREGGRTYYAVRMEKGKAIPMHRQIMKAPADLFVDHKDGDGLNNQRSNLRLATLTQNSRNQRKRVSKGSRYKGVYPRKKCKRWSAVITANKVRQHLGLFKTELEAAQAYDEAAKRLHGEFASLNLED